MLRHKAATAAWRLRERAFAVDDYYAEDGDSHAFVVAGRSRATVTAVHSVNTTRDGRMKLADRGTGGLALTLAELLNVQGVVRATARPRHDQSPIVRVIRSMAVRSDVVLDLHGMRDRGDVDVELGTGARADAASVEFAHRLQRAFTEAGMSVAVDEVFRGARPDSVVSLCRAVAVPAVQIELAARCRPPLGQPALMDAVIDAFVRFNQALETQQGDDGFGARVSGG